jgi:CBS domain-containing protein
MRSVGARQFPVSSDGKFVGTMNAPDIDRSVAKYGHDPSSLNVEDCMSPPTFHCHPNQSISEVLALMEQQSLNHIAVVDDDLTLIGIASRARLKRAINTPTTAPTSEAPMDEMRPHAPGEPKSERRAAAS